jgi:hypothetical protein
MGDLVARLDVLDRPDLDDVFDEKGPRVRPARVIDVAAEIAAVGTVDPPGRIELEQIAGVELVSGFGANLLRARLPDRRSRKVAAALRGAPRQRSSRTPC